MQLCNVGKNTKIIFFKAKRNYINIRTICKIPCKVDLCAENGKKKLSFSKYIIFVRKEKEW